MHVYEASSLTITETTTSTSTNKMHATSICHMARGKGKTIPIKLVSSAGTGFFYTTRKNVANTPEKLNLLKYDPIVRRRVVFKEGKIK